jgi:hypothetical protein
LDWSELRKSKLGKPGLRDLAPDPLRRQDRLGARVGELWGRFTAFSLWEQGAVLGVIILALAIVPIVIFTLTRGGSAETTADGPEVPAFLLLPTATPRPPEPTETRLPTITPRPTSTHTPEVVNREDCDAIAGTPYQSDEERLWYLDNCPDTPTDEPPPGGGSPPTQPPPPPPTPTSGSGMTPSEAISRTVSWLGSQGISVSASGCSAAQGGGQWVVTCASGGGGTVSVCLRENPVVLYLC